MKGKDIPQQLLRLRTAELKKYREWRDAALFCYGLGLSQGHLIEYATEEAADYDFIARWSEGSTEHFTPVQLKEVVPAELNPNTTVTDLLEKVSRASATDTVLVIRHNRAGKFDPTTLTIPRLPWKQLWFFWASAPNASRWCIYGDALEEPAYFAFNYPQAA